MRKGYLLTALAAAVLLAASSGTAYAQSIGFQRDFEAASLMERRAPGMGTSNPITILPLSNVSGLPSGAWL